MSASCARCCRSRARRCARRSRCSPPRAWWNCCRNRGAIAVALTRPTCCNTFEVMAGLEAHVGRARRAAHHRRGTGRDPRHALRDAGRLHAARPVQPTTGSTRRSTARSTPPPRTRCSRATYDQVNARLQALRFRSNQDGDKWKRAMTRTRTDDRSAGRARRGRHARRCSLAHLKQQARRGAGAAARGSSRARKERTMNAPLPLDRRPRGGRHAYDTVAATTNEVAGRLAAAPGQRKRRARCCSRRPTAAAMPPMPRSTR